MVVKRPAAIRRRYNQTLNWTGPVFGVNRGIVRWSGGRTDFYNGVSVRVLLACAALFVVLTAGFLITHASAEQPSAAGATETTGASPPTFVGHKVSVYFRGADKISLKEIPTGNLTYLGGVVRQSDAEYLTLTLKGGDTCWIPKAAIAYVRSDDESKSPTTIP